MRLDQQELRVRLELERHGLDGSKSQDVRTLTAACTRPPVIVGGPGQKYARLQFYQLGLLEGCLGFRICIDTVHYCIQGDQKTLHLCAVLLKPPAAPFAQAPAVSHPPQPSVNHQ